MLDNFLKNELWKHLLSLSCNEKCNFYPKFYFKLPVFINSKASVTDIPCNFAFLTQFIFCIPSEEK